MQITQTRCGAVEGWRRPQERKYQTSILVLHQYRDQQATSSNSCRYWCSQILHFKRNDPTPRPPIGTRTNSKSLARRRHHTTGNQWRSGAICENRRNGDNSASVSYGNCRVVASWVRIGSAPTMSQSSRTKIELSFSTRKGTRLHRWQWTRVETAAEETQLLVHSPFSQRIT